MPDLRENAITLLSSTSSVDMQTAAKTTLFTVPTGKSAVITAVIIHTLSATLAGGTDFDFGTDANCTTHKQTVDLSSLTATTDSIVISFDDSKYPRLAAADAFGIYPSTGSTGAATAVIDVFGYLY